MAPLACVNSLSWLFGLDLCSDHYFFSRLRRMIIGGEKFFCFREEDIEELNFTFSGYGQRRWSTSFIGFTWRLLSHSVAVFMVIIYLLPLIFGVCMWRLKGPFLVSGWIRDEMLIWSKLYLRMEFMTGSLIWLGLLLSIKEPYNFGC